MQRGTEMGASEFIFFKSTRTSSKSSYRVDRLQSISFDASRQSGRVYNPLIQEILFESLNEVLEKVFFSMQKHILFEKN